MPRKRKQDVVWEKAPDIQKLVTQLLDSLDLPWINPKRVYVFRSQNTSTRAYARIWGLTRIFQLALDIEPAYVIEVISEKFDKLSIREKNKVLIHELVHIPKTFSGSLTPHTRRRRGRLGFEDKVHHLIKAFERKFSK